MNLKYCILYIKKSPYKKKVFLKAPIHHHFEQLGWLETDIVKMFWIIGFMLAMVMFSGIRERMESSDIPKFMQGLPITLVAASLVSVSFLGFTGIVENIFG